MSVSANKKKLCLIHSLIYPKLVDEYIKLNLKLQQSLLDDYDPEKSLDIAITDWNRDSCGNSSIDFSRYFFIFFI